MRKLRCAGKVEAKHLCREQQSQGRGFTKKRGRGREGEGDGDRGSRATGGKRIINPRPTYWALCLRQQRDLSYKFGNLLDVSFSKLDLFISS